MITISDILFLAGRYMTPALAVMVLGCCVFSLVGRQFGTRIGSYLYDPGSKKRLPLRHWENSVGRSRTCDVVLSLPDVSRFHAVISKRRSGWVVTDTHSSAGVSVNGQAITKETRINHGDKVSFGRATFVFVDADEDEKEQAERANRSTISRRANVWASRMIPSAEFYPAIIDNTASKAYVLGSQSCIFGRAPDCSAQLRYASVSRRHARVSTSGGLWYIEDLGSTGGTTVNGRPVGGSACLLHDGDVISMGGIIFIFNERYKLKSRFGSRGG